MHFVLPGFRLVSSYLLDRIMKNAFEYEAELAALREELAKIRKGLSYIDNLLRQTDRCLLSEKQRNNALGRALSGLLFEFDDGVNGGREEPIPSLDYARSLVNAIKFKPTESGASE